MSRGSASGWIGEEHAVGRARRVRGRDGHLVADAAGRAGRERRRRAAGSAARRCARRAPDRRPGAGVHERARPARRSARRGRARPTTCASPIERVELDAAHRGDASSSTLREEVVEPAAARADDRAPGRAARDARRRARARGRWRPCRPGDARPRRRRRPRASSAAGSTESRSPTTRSTCTPERVRVLEPGVGRDRRRRRRQAASDRRPRSRSPPANTIATCPRRDRARQVVPSLPPPALPGSGSRGRRRVMRSPSQPG